MITPEEYQSELALAAGQYTEEDLSDLGMPYDYEDAERTILNYIYDDEDIEDFKDTIIRQRKRFKIDQPLEENKMKTKYVKLFEDWDGFETSHETFDKYYRQEVKNLLGQIYNLPEIPKDKVDITFDALEDRLSVYDSPIRDTVITIIDRSLFGSPTDLHSDYNQIKDVAISNQDNTGTEIKMIVNCLIDAIDILNKINN